MRKFFSKIKELFVWITSKEVKKAINDGATYDEVFKIVKKEMAR